MDSTISSHQNLRRELLSMEPQAATESITNYLLQTVVEVKHLSAESRDAIAPAFPYLSLIQAGLDSLTTIAIHNQIKVDLNVFVPIERLIGDVKIRQVVDLIYDQLMFNRLTEAKGQGSMTSTETETYTL
jgi:hypothetical protein